MFVPKQAYTNNAFHDFFQTLIPTLSAADHKALDALYPDPATNGSSPYRPVPRGYGQQWARLDAAYGHYAYICPVLQTAHFLSTNTSASASSKVYVFEFAARSGQTGTANHGDAQTVIGHNLNYPARVPGLVRVSDAMHGAWARFVARGDPNPIAANATTVPWEPFMSPITTSSPTGEEKEEEGRQRGRLMVFGEGNDERMGPWGRGHPGTPTRMRNLSEYELQQCRFWWDRVELSQGLGTPPFADDPSAKL